MLLEREILMVLLEFVKITDIERIKLCFVYS